MTQIFNYTQLSSYYQRSFYTNTSPIPKEIPLFQSSIIPIHSFNETKTSKSIQTIELQKQTEVNKITDEIQTPI